MNLLIRAISALIGIPLAVVLIFSEYKQGLPFAIAIGIISVMGAHEFYRGVRKIGSRPIEWAGLLAVALFVVSARTYQISTIGAIFPAVLTLLLVLSFCAEFARAQRAPVINVGATIFGAIYVGWLIMHLVVLRGLPGTCKVGSCTESAGACLVLLAFLGTWACDTGAYFAGRFLGKHKLAPRLSPGKTIEGAIGGLVGSVLVTGICGTIIHLPVGHCIALGIMFGVLSQLGDLSESAIKREIGIKDFGNIVPGHGGILDRFDSLLFTGPAAYYYAILFLGTWLH